MFDRSELKRRAFQRAALALFSFWEEQRDTYPRSAAVHSRIFETLIYDEYIAMNERGENRTYREHVVPCAYIRNYAFKMFWDKRTVNDVADMIGRLLRIVYITHEEADALNSRHRDTMPSNWNPETGSILQRLEEKNIIVVCPFGG